MFPFLNTTVCLFLYVLLSAIYVPLNNHISFAYSWDIWVVLYSTYLIVVVVIVIPRTTNGIAGCDHVTRE